jgi:hypothetical protein
VFAELDYETLVLYGRKLDKRFAGGETVQELLMRALLKVRDKQGRLVPLIPNAAQRAYASQCTRRNIVLKARQLGITTFVAARFFLKTITRPGTLTVQVAHDQRSAEEIFRIVHRFLENLPHTLRQGALMTSRANVRQIVFPRLDSEYRVETAADPCAGRGLTIRNLHGSEVARWPREAAATLASLRAAVPREGEIVLESTPNGAGGCFYEEWQNAGKTGYQRHFLPWWLEAEYARPGVHVGALTDEEEELVRREHLSEAQIAFRREVQAQFRKFAVEEFAEDAESCFLASNECLFDVPTLEARRKQLGPAAEARDNAQLLIFLPAKPGAEYVIGVDPAGGGVDGDYACAEVIERTTGMQCAELHGHFPPQELAAKIAALGREYNDAVIAVERNNHGHAVLAHLEASEHYRNVFEQGNQRGWLTSSVTRPRMISEFAAVMAAQPGLFYSARLMEECRTFVRREDGSPAAANGTHDDCVMAMAIALAVREATADRPKARAVGWASM